MKCFQFSGGECLHLDLTDTSSATKGSLTSFFVVASITYVYNTKSCVTSLKSTIEDILPVWDVSTKVLKQPQSAFIF